MATLTTPTSVPTPQEVTAAEDRLFDLFVDHLETVTPEQRATILADLRASAEAHGE